MKKINILLLLSIFALAFVACEKDQDMYKVLPIEEVTPPELAPHADIVIDADNLSSTTTFKWQRADFGTPAAIEYSLIIPGISEDKLVSSSFGDSLSIMLSDLNTIILQAGATVGVENNITFILKASISTSYESAVSAPVFVKITPFAAVPSPLHLIGNVLGSKEWNNANYEYIMFRDNNLAANVYTTTFRTGGFKFIAEENLGTWDDLYGKASDGVLGNKTGNDITDIVTAGYYTVTANIINLTYSITPYDASSANTYTNISLIGAFNGWSGDLDLVQTDYDTHIWIVDDANLPSGELKFRANHDWPTNWGATDQFPYGKGTGGGSNIIVPESGVYFVKFNDLTGHYVFYKK
ncbi:MAG: SusE domain-containing protein [Prevotellaceae bacterium]|nr:SusE domain-containing protein [Prevotellaceae bacterium]